MANIIEPFHNITITSICHLDLDAQWFRELLARNNAAPRSSSPFDRSLQAVEDISRVYRGEIPQVADDYSFPLVLREALGTVYLIEAIKRTLPETEKALAGRWHIFRGPDICLTRDAPQSEERNSTWETIVGVKCAHFASDMAFTTNPDIRCLFSKIVWGIECKILYTYDQDNQIERIVEGGKQIEDSEVEFGIVAINATNLINHDRFFGPMPGHPGSYLNFPDPQNPMEMLRSLLDRIVKGVDGPKIVRRLTMDKEGEQRIKTRAVMFFAQTVASIRKAPTILSMVDWYNFRPLTVGEEDFLSSFKHACQ